MIKISSTDSTTKAATDSNHMDSNRAMVHPQLPTMRKALKDNKADMADRRSRADSHMARAIRSMGKVSTVSNSMANSSTASSSNNSTTPTLAGHGVKVHHHPVTRPTHMATNAPRQIQTTRKKVNVVS